MLVLIEVNLGNSFNSSVESSLYKLCSKFIRKYSTPEIFFKLIVDINGLKSLVSQLKFVDILCYLKNHVIAGFLRKNKA